jgi:hypothetical protein
LPATTIAGVLATLQRQSRFFPFASFQQFAHPDSADSQVTGKISLADEAVISEHPAVSLLERCVVDWQLLRPYGSR